MNARLENPYWEYFQHLAAAFAENGKAIEVISKASALQGAAGREALLSMDYSAVLTLTPGQMTDEKTIVLEQGYHFFVTSLDAYELEGNPLISSQLQFTDDAGETDFSGGPLVSGQPAGEKGMIQIFNVSQGYDQTILQEPRQFFAYVGNRGILKVKASQAAADNKKISILISGFKICLSEV